MNDETRLERELAGKERSVKLTELAQDQLAIWDKYKRTQGGITPAQLQELMGTWGEIANPGMQQFSLGDAAHLLLTNIMRGHDERETIANVMLSLMHYAHIHSFDLTETVGDWWRAHLEDQGK